MMPDGVEAERIVRLIAERDAAIQQRDEALRILTATRAIIRNFYRNIERNASSRSHRKRQKESP